MKSNFLSVAFSFYLMSHLSAQAWEGRDASFPYSLWGESVYAINDSVAWTWGIDLDQNGLNTLEKNVISKTKDKGLSWYNVVSPFNSLSFVTSICALSYDTAWVTFASFADINDPEPSGNKVMMTTDGGFHWTQVNVSVDVFVDFIYMWNAMEGIVVGDPDTLGFEIYQTLDGGETWNRILKQPESKPDEYLYKDNYAIRGNELWFATTTGRIFHTDSKGSAWDVMESPLTGHFVEIMNVDDDGNIYLVYNQYFVNSTSYEYILFRKDAGSGQWVNVTQPNAAFIYDLFPVPQTDAIIRTIYSDSFRTQISYDQGTNWMDIDSINRATYLSFYDPNIGYAAQANWASDPSKTLVYRYVGSPLSGLLKNVPLSNASLHATPNPTSGETSISLQDITPGQYWILVHDISGNLKYKVDLFAVDILEEKLDLGSLPAGVYTITVSSNQGVATTKITKQ